MSRCTWRSRLAKIYGIAGYQLITLIFGSRHVAVPWYRGIAIVPFCAGRRVRVSSRTRAEIARRNAVFGRPPLPVAAALIDRRSSRGESRRRNSVRVLNSGNRDFIPLSKKPPFVIESFINRRMKFFPIVKFVNFFYVVVSFIITARKMDCLNYTIYCLCSNGRFKISKFLKKLKFSGKLEINYEIRRVINTNILNMSKLIHRRWQTFILFISYLFILLP